METILAHNLWNISSLPRFSNSAPKFLSQAASAGYPSTGWKDAGTGFTAVHQGPIFHVKAKSSPIWEVPSDGPLLEEPVGIIIVDHGSRKKSSNDLLDSFVNVFKEETGRQFVVPAHMELAEPSIEQAFATCVQRGAQTIIVTPYFLSPGRHWQQDIPHLVQMAAEKHPGIQYMITAPIGVHRLVASVLEERIQSCIAHCTGGGEDCEACRGTRDCSLYRA